MGYLFIHEKRVYERMILVYERELTHYRVPVFLRLQQRVEEDVFVVHGNGPRESYLNTVDEEEDLDFGHERVATYWMGGDKMAFQNVTPHLLEKRPSTVIVRGGIRQFHLFPLLLFYKLWGIPLLVWGQGYSRKRDFRPRRHLIDRTHLSVVQLSDAYVCYNEKIKETLTQYCSSEKLFVASNTLSVEEHLKTRRQLESLGREAIHRQLNLECQQYLCFIGRLQPRKRLDYLLEVYRCLISKSDIDVGLIIIGEGPERSKVEAEVERRGLTDVHLVGAQYGEDAGRYLVASDAMVMPGWLGLAVNHALAYGLPIVSQHGIAHAPESIHVKHGKTGWFAEANQRDEMVEGIEELLVQKEAYRERCLQYARNNLTMDSMMKGFERAITYARSLT